MVCALGVLTLLVSFGGQALGQASPDILWRTNGHSSGASREGVLSIAFNPASSLVASGGGPGDRSVKVWRVADGGLVKILSNTVERVDSVAFSPDGEVLAANGGQRGQLPDFRDYTLINFWDTMDWSWYAVTNVAFTPAAQLVFSHNGKYLAAAGGDWYGDLAVFEMPSGNLLNRYGEYITGYNSLAFSPDDRELAASVFGALCTQIRNATNGAVRIDLQLTGSVAYSPDGVVLLVALSSGIVLINTTTAAAITELFHPAAVSTAVFTPDGKAIVSWAGDNKIRFWSMRDYSVFQEYDQETTDVWALAVALNGRYFAYGRDDGVVVVAQMPLWITDIVKSNNEVRLAWSGGSGLYQLQRTTDLASGVWENIGDPTTETTAAVSAANTFEFFRVQSLAQR